MKSFHLLPSLALLFAIAFTSCGESFDAITYNDTIVDAHTASLESIEAFLMADEPADFSKNYETSLETVTENLATVTALADVENGFKQEGVDILNFYKSELETKGSKLAKMYDTELDSEQSAEFDALLDAIFEDEDKYMEALMKAQEAYSDHYDMMLIE